jgi:hypothetical protein
VQKSVDGSETKSRKQDCSVCGFEMVYFYDELSDATHQLLQPLGDAKQHQRRNTCHENEQHKEVV